MQVLIEPGKTKDVLVTIAIGASHYSAWAEYALPTWRQYCERHDLGLIVFDADLISRDSKIWKKATWQKLLIGQTLQREMPAVRNVCFLDTDILVNYTAPNVFDGYDPTTIGLVSVHHNLPYPRDQALCHMAFLRNKYYDASYPLDSSLFLSIKRLYEIHGLPPQKDEACMGFILFNAHNHALVMSEWFAKYDREIVSVTGGGDQTHANYEMQSWGKISWLEYRWQAMWTYEMAWKYPFLYSTGRTDKKLIRECIEASLFTNYFLHFAGSWYESDMWKEVRVLETRDQREMFERYSEYAKTPATGEPVGSIKPTFKYKRGK